MIVCSCNVVTDRQIRACVARGATTVREVARSCRAATGCGGCRLAVQAILSEAREERAPVPPELESAPGLSVGAR